MTMLLAATTSTEQGGISEETWRRLSDAAWAARNHAHVIGNTRVGAAVFAASGNVYAGCNVEHRFRSHDVHAEINALATMVAAGEGPAVAILVASERERFTPCGACLDWIFELGGQAMLVAFEPAPGGERQTWRAEELMPFYPR